MRDLGPSNSFPERRNQPRHRIRSDLVRSRFDDMVHRRAMLCNRVPMHSDTASIAYGVFAVALDIRVAFAGYRGGKCPARKLCLVAGSLVHDVFGPH
jgi:hypothetical protein